MATVLVIDDDHKFAAALKAMLEQEGYDVLWASDGTEAVNLLETRHREISLTIVDLALPGINGFEIIGALSRRPNPVKIIATSGVYKETQLHLAGSLGAHAVIRKPPPGKAPPRHDWLATVNRLIGKPAAEKRARATRAPGTSMKTERTNGPKDEGCGSPGSA